MPVRRVLLLRRFLIFRSRGQDIRGTTRDSRREDTMIKVVVVVVVAPRPFMKGNFLADKRNVPVITIYNYLDARASNRRRRCRATFSRRERKTFSDLSHARQSVITSALALIRPAAKTKLPDSENVTLNLSIPAILYISAVPPKFRSA